MYSTLLPLAAVAGLLLQTAVARPADPRAIINRAIEARGGKARLTQARAVHVRIKGTLHGAGGLPFTAETFSQGLDQFRHDMRYQRFGSTYRQLQVYNGEQVWIRTDNGLLNLEPEILAALKKGRYAEGLTKLYVLEGKEYGLAAAGEADVEGRPAIGVKVTAKDRPDVTLYFDKGTGLLVKTAHRQLDPSSRQEVLQEVFYRDYRELDPAASAEAVLRRAKVGLDGPALLAWLRRQMRTGPEWNRLQALVRQLGDRTGRVRDQAADALVARGLDVIPLLQQAQKDPDAEVARRAAQCLERLLQAQIRRLGDDDFAVRQQASADLVTVGTPVVPLLEAAIKDRDPEVARRATECLRRIREGSATGLPSAVVWLVAVRRPAGAAETLLDYLPFAPGEEVADDIRAALVTLAQRDGKPEPVLLRALEDKDPLRRQAARIALGRDGGAFARKPGHRLHLPGLKQPTKVTVTRDGRHFADWEVVDVEYFSQFDAKVFAKP